MIDFVAQLMPFVVPIIAMIVGLIMGRPALISGIIFLWFGSIHLFVNMYVCTYDLTYSPSPGGPPIEDSRDTSSGVNGWAKAQVTGFFVWSYTAFIIATVIGVMALASKLFKMLKIFNFVYPKHMISKILLIVIGILGIVFNTVSINHTSKCDSREFDLFAEHNYIPLVSFAAGLVLIILALTTTTREKLAGQLAGIGFPRSNRIYATF